MNLSEYYYVYFHKDMANIYSQICVQIVFVVLN